MKSCFTFGFFAVTLLAQSASIALGSALPAGYTPVDWIKGDGTSAYYTTDYVPNPETDCIVIEFKFDSPMDKNHRALFSDISRSEPIGSPRLPRKLIFLTHNSTPEKD